MNEDNHNPSVSIVTLTYRKFDRLFETIESVINQDYKNIEYIIADDGSQDFPKDKILNFFKSKNFSNYLILDSKVNRGTVKNINNAYKKSSGEFLFNLSCGDVLFSENVISQIVDRLISTNADFLTTSRVLYDNKFEPICFLPHYCDRKKIESWDSPAKQYKAFVTSSFLDMASGSCMCLTRQIIEKLNYFDEKYVLWEDGPFIEKYLRDYMIIPAFDIISIWYENSGVSNSVMHPILYADTVKFNESDKMTKYATFNWWNKLKIKYRNESMICKDSGRRLLLKIKYFPVFCYFFNSWLRSKINVKTDNRYLKKMSL